MKLPDWLKAEEKTQAWLAGKVDVDEISIYRYCAGLRFPTRKVLERIVRVTKGAVTPNDFLGPPRKAIRPKKRKADFAKLRRRGRSSQSKVASPAGGL